MGLIFIEQPRDPCMWTLCLLPYTIDIYLQHLLSLLSRFGLRTFSMQEISQAKQRWPEEFADLLKPIVSAKEEFHSFWFSPIHHTKDCTMKESRERWNVVDKSLTQVWQNTQDWQQRGLITNQENRRSKELKKHLNLFSKLWLFWREARF